ncbi:hypothetical protein PBT90_00215 [Algoriphagus halophytocola]|uniref:hypothetical protein n=1 Tax=Algoriphagus halophytocola TaxID=2991499 RepID=UPI0022DDBF5B|nr:hypothetical protein [Algoriphagus sp. TR-M9]WBL43132.1 hypothetical protein PBT90_00215 [Algoriphagus sp. TR-M9]
MKKSSAILLLVCFAMYHFGYYAFYFSYEHVLEQQWESQVYSGEFNEQAEQLMKIPLSMPYMANQEEFQITNTPFEKDGQSYRAIKQRYQNDTLQLIVVPDVERKVLKNTVQKWISTLTDEENPTENKGSTVVKFFVKDYMQPKKFLFEPFISQPISNSNSWLDNLYLDPELGLISPPPQFS